MTGTQITIRPLEAVDWEEWRVLWEGYNTYYKRSIPDEVTRTTWNRFFDVYEPVHAFVAADDDDLIGFVHCLYHRSTSMLPPICYLQDLFTSPAARGRGAAGY